MTHKYKSASRLAKAFTWLSVLLLLAFVVTYALEVRYALNMDPNSYNCLHDSMMKQMCQDPYGSSVGWAIIGIGVIGWPFLLAWLAMGMALLIIRAKRPGKDKLSPRIQVKNRKGTDG